MAAHFDGTLAMGIGLGVASMLSVGPNNLLLLREGFARGRTITVATTVWSSDMTLLASAMIFSDVPQWIGPSARIWLSWGGLAALSWFAVNALRAALRSNALGADVRKEDRNTCLKRVLAVVWCNPLSYLELFLVPAAYCATLTGHAQRIEFIATVAIMNGVACYGYALGGAICGRLVSDRRVIRVFDAVSGLLLAGSAITLALALAV